MDASQRGYMNITLTPQAATNQWVFMETVATKSLATAPGKTMRVQKGRNVLDPA